MELCTVTALSLERQHHVSTARKGSLDKYAEVVMTIRMLSRRRLLATVGSAAVATGLDGIARPYLSRAADRPVITHGIQSGDVSLDSGMVWARADRPSRMTVEVATTDSFKTIHSGVFVHALPESDFTANALLENLPAGQGMVCPLRFSAPPPAARSGRP